MNTPIVFLYNLQNSKGAKIKMQCHKLHIRFKSVEKTEYKLKLKELANLVPVENREEPLEDFNAEMLVFVHFTQSLLNTFLESIRKAKVPVALKAVYTDYNSNLDSVALYHEIHSEHEMMTKHGQSLHSKKESGTP